MRTLSIAKKTLVLHLQHALTSLASSTVNVRSTSLVMTAGRVSMLCLPAHWTIHCVAWWLYVGFQNMS